jgi:predicted enzyme related to lactoylglutathione lyase
MALGIHALSFDALDPVRLAGFWSGVLGWELVEDPRDGVVVMPDDDTGFRLHFVPTRVPKSGPNQMHFDLTSASLADQQHTVARALALGGRHLDVGQLPEEEHVVLADPEGNEFCVIEPGNSFLADCGFIGALSSDGLREVGCFWSKALDWPLVWDQDGETAIRAPYGGPKISWGGPPVAPKVGRNRLRFELMPTPGTDQQAEVDRLVSLGATRIDREMLADPRGNEFYVLRRTGG